MVVSGLIMTISAIVTVWGMYHGLKLSASRRVTILGWAAWLMGAMTFLFSLSYFTSGTT